MGVVLGQWRVGTVGWNYGELWGIMGNYGEMCADLPFQSLKLAIETVFCAPPITDPHKKALEKDFGRYGVVWKGDVLHCTPCNCKINETIKQKVIDHIISDEHDQRLLEGSLTTQFHVAPGFEVRQQQRDNNTSRRQRERQVGGKRPHTKMVQQPFARYPSRTLPPTLSGAIAFTN